MRFLKRLLWATMVAGIGLHATPAAAQTGSVTTGGGASPGSLGGTGGLGGGAGGMGGGGSSGNSLGGTPLATMQPAPTIAAPAGAASGVMSSSNFLSGYYGNPYFQGTLANARAGNAAGGFGTPLYGTGSGSGAGGSIGSASSRTTGTTGLGTTGGQTGGQGGQGQNSSTGNSAYGTIIAPTAQIAYPAIIRFPTAPVASTQLQTDVTGMLSRSTSTIPTAAGIQVLAQGGTVTLRGTVADAEEARLVEGMVRLTPGVFSITNELTFPVSK